MLKPKTRLLLLLTVILLALGVLLIFDVSATTSLERLFSDDPYFVVKHQLLMMAGGLILAGIAGFVVPSDWYTHWPRLVYFGGLVLLALPLFWGDASHGAQRWIEIAGISVQTSEFAKLAFIIFFAHLTLQTHDERIFLGWLLPPAALLLAQKDFGSLMIIAAPALMSYFLAGASLWQVSKVVLLCLTAGLILIFASPYRRERIGVYMSGMQDNVSAENIDDYHVKQLQYAIGRGRLFGQGIGQSRQKFRYLPEVHTDSIFAILSEEVGFMGVLVVFFIYMCFLGTIVWIGSAGALSREQQLIVYGIFVSLVSQIFVNLAAISGVTPLTGITLPFLSYGGSSLMATLLLTGVVANFSQLSSDDKQTMYTRRKYV